MNSGTMKFFSHGLSWTLGHFVYQALFGAPNWNTAIERSYFTVLALLWIWWQVRVEFRTKQEAA